MRAGAVWGMPWGVRSAKATPKAACGLVEAALRGELTEEQARRLARSGPEVVAFAFLATSQRIAELRRDEAKPSASTPSGMVPVYTKPNAPKRHKRPGARKGHAGVRRPPPVKIDERQSHRLKCCPDCGQKLQRCERSRTRIIEDIPEIIEPVVTEHTVHRDYCPNCKKDIEPAVPDAMPRATLGHRIVALTGWFHYGLGLTIDQIVKVLDHHLQTQLTAGGLVQAWQRLGDVLGPWYEQIAKQAKKSAVLHADETGWRVNGQTHWLWCFANGQVCYYMVDRSRGSPALQQFFTEAFEGVLITDFWSAYGSVCAEDRQYCLVHLLRELEKVDEHNDSSEWQAFAKKLRRILRDAIRLRKQEDFAPGAFQSRVDRLNKRLASLADDEHVDGDARRLTKRLRKHAEHLFTFLDYAEVPFENNLAERQIRPAVVLRKNSQSNRSDRGAATQGALMSIYQTLKLRGLDPTKTIVDALRTHVATGRLPPLPT